MCGLETAVLIFFSERKIQGQNFLPLLRCDTEDHAPWGHAASVILCEAKAGTFCEQRKSAQLAYTDRMIFLVEEPKDISLEPTLHIYTRGRAPEDDFLWALPAIGRRSDGLCAPDEIVVSKS
jgi:hypothetical protein